MASKRIKAALAAVKPRPWTFETKTEPNAFLGLVKDETGRVVLTVREDSDYNQLSRMMNTSKYMQNRNDMRGLAKYLVDRCLVPMTDAEKEKLKSKKVIPIEITEVVL